MDASIKNNITTSISYVHIHNKPITKTLHHTVNVMSTEAELFAIRCSINQATNSASISKSLSSPIQFMLQGRFLICHLILSKVMQPLSLKSFKPSSHIIRRTQLNSGNVLADATGLSIK